MRVIRSPAKMQKTARSLKSRGHTLALVPTMGFLHAGHLALVRRARLMADKVIVSIFVNPTQFGPSEDFSRYPRDTRGDLAKLKMAGVDCVFMPTARAMYPDYFQTQVTVREVSRGLCGDARPGHFDGVAGVVLKLMNITQPDIAVFGKKDFQQLTVIKTMVRDLNLPVRIVGVPIVREKDGLAMSSRNVYLSADERVMARGLSRGLKAARDAANAGEARVAGLISRCRAELPRAPQIRVDYVACVNALTLKPLSRPTRKKTLMAVAVFVGRTRLIDNAVF